MSRSLYWQPVPRPSEPTLPDALMFALDKRHEGEPWWTDQFGTDDLPYLHGLRDAGVEGADELITLVEKHGAIELSVHG